MKNSGFRHYRHMKPNTELGSVEVATRGGVTMAFEAPKHINDLVDSDKVFVAFSFCSGDDNFNRQRGREVAQERLNQGPRLTIPAADFIALLRTTHPADIPLRLEGLDYERGHYLAGRIRATIGNC